MVITWSEGPLGLAGYHQWNDGIVLGGAGYPRYKLDRIGGWGSLPEVSDNTFQNVGRVGESMFRFGVQGRTLTYEGRIQARTHDELLRMKMAMEAAFYGRQFDGRMVINCHPDAGNAPWSFLARVMQLEIDEEQTRGPTAQPSPHQREFILGLRLGDPRLVSWDGAYTVPQITDPVAASGDTVFPENLGSAPADPYFDIYGPINPDVTVVRGGDRPATLKVDYLDVPDGHTLRVDFRDQTVKDITAGKDYTARVVFAESDWWDEGADGLLPGVTPVGVVAPGSNGWRVAYRHSAY